VFGLGGRVEAELVDVLGEETADVVGLVDVWEKIVCLTWRLGYR